MAPRISAPRYRKPRKKTPFNNTIVYDFGCRFRSKFEHRIAKRLEAANIKWQFEPRIKIDDSYRYPDFYLPDYKLFLEARPKKRINDELLWKIRRIKKDYGNDVVIISDIKGADTFIKRLLTCKKEQQNLAPMHEYMLFEGTRGERKENYRAGSVNYR
jgi:hypothetical protein